MISTPETGVDSIAVTWALLDPIMTVIRPVSAFFTASITGLAVNVLDPDEKTQENLHSPGRGGALFPMATASPLPVGADCGCVDATCEPESKPLTLDSCCTTSSCTAPTKSLTPDDCGCGDPSCAAETLQAPPTKWDKLKYGMSFSFGTLLGEIGPWLLIGVGLAAVISVFLSPDFIHAYMGSGIVSMLIMIVLATPLYVCATASTPIAAALALKGLSPGAALVFLLAGPATNMATITIVAKLLGRKTAIIYVVSIMACSLIMGMVVNMLYFSLGLNIADWVHQEALDTHGLVYSLSAVILLILIFKPMIKNLYSRAVRR